MISSFIVSSDEILFNNSPIDSIEILAKVQEMRETSLRYEFFLVDFTGSLTAFAYKKTTTGKQKMFKEYEFLDNSYALIHGNMRKAQDSFQVFISSIRNVKSRSEIDEFLSRVVLGFIKTHRPVIEKPSSNEEIVLKGMKTAAFNSKGYTAAQVKDFLNSKISIIQIEEALNELLFQGFLKAGQDFNHFILIKQ
jgi:hypothetical protein